MINRNYLQCLTCRHETMTRVAICHSNYQEFAFPCQNCGVEIRFGMDLDQVNAEFRYSKLINAVWIDSLLEPPEIDVRVFDTETLLPLGIGTFFSPFLLTSHLPKDKDKFHKERVLRIQLCQDFWPIIQKLKVHYENRNWDLYRKEWQAIEPDFNEKREPRLIAHFLRNLHKFGEVFRPFLSSQSQLLRQRINLAESISLKACLDIVQYLRSIGWIDSLFNELYSIKDRWVHLYEIVQPVYISLYWDERENNLDAYAVSQKRFDEMKPLFVDIYETLCRISVIAATLEGIIFLKKPCVPKGTSEMLPDEYRGVENGRKYDIFQKLVPAKCFSFMADSTMRNGIGHHSAHYDVKTDAILYRKENKKGIKQFKISYTRFSEAMIKLYGQFDVASVYINWVIARHSGLQGKVV
jgi:hypothetical protein